MSEQKFLTKTEGTIVIAVPPVTLPTPITAARWLYKSPAVRGLLLVLLGVALGHWYSQPASVLPDKPPTVTVQTESLEDFVARESQVLTAEERRKLIAVTEKILAEHFDEPYELREAFRYERLKAEIDSPAFAAFSENWVRETADSRRQTAAEDSVEATRSIYESLLRGLKIQAYNDFSGDPVEGFLSREVSPSNVTPLSTDGDVPGTPDFGGNNGRFFSRLGSRERSR